MKKGISTLLLLSFICFPTGISYGQAKQPRRPKMARASTDVPAPMRSAKPLALLRSSEFAGGARLTVTSDGPIGTYNTHQSDGRFYLKLAAVDGSVIEKGLRGRGFEDLQVEQQGEDVLLSFRLQEGASAQVGKKFNRLDITITDSLAAKMQSAAASLLRNANAPASLRTPKADALTPTLPPLMQDQVETINDPLQELTDATGIDMNSGKITGNKQNEVARALIERTLGSAVLSDPNFYCIIHIVKWQWGGQTLSKDPVVASQNWYVYHKATKYEETGWGSKKFEGTRIYGSKNIGLLYIYLNAPSTTEADINANELAKADLAQRKSARVVGGKTVVKLGNTNNFVVQDYLRIAYKVAVTKKLPAPVQNARTLLGILQAETPQVTLEVRNNVNLWGGRVMTLTPLPADISVQAFLATLDGGQNEIGKQTYDNEQRYHYDFSAGIPAQGVKELQFNADNNTVGPRKIERQNVYAFLDLYPVATDTKGLGFMKFPGLIFGLPIKGKPFDHPVAGINFGLNRVKLFGGVVFNRVREPATLGAGDTATPSELEADLRTRYVRKFIWGVNVPLRQVKDALK